MKKIWEHKTIPTIVSVACFLAALIVGLPWCLNRLYYRHDRTFGTTKYIYLGYLAFFLIVVGILIPIMRRFWLCLKLSKHSPFDGVATILIGILSSIPLALLITGTHVLFRVKFVNKYKVFHFSLTVAIFLLGIWLRFHGKRDTRARILAVNHLGPSDYLTATRAAETDPFNVVAGINLEENRTKFKDRIVALAIGKFVKLYAIAVDRHDETSKALTIRKIYKELEDGKNIVIFPEGTRTTMEKILQGVLLQEFNTGIFKIAWKKKLIVQPVVFDFPATWKGKEDPWWGIRPGSIDGYYLESIDPDDFENSDAMEKACWDAMHAQLAKSKKAARLLSQFKSVTTF